MSCALRTVGLIRPREETLRSLTLTLAQSRMFAGPSESPRFGVRPDQARPERVLVLRAATVSSGNDSRSASVLSSARLMQ